METTRPTKFILIRIIDILFYFINISFLIYVLADVMLVLSFKGWTRDLVLFIPFIGVPLIFFISLGAIKTLKKTRFKWYAVVGGMEFVFLLLILLAISMSQI